MARVVQPATCPACDDEFLPNRHNRKLIADQVYCSNRCSAGPRSARSPLGFRQYWVPGGRTVYRTVRAPTRVCDQCGTAYTPKRREERNQFCSRACKDAARFEAPEPRPCLACGALFTPARNLYAAFCSKACNQRARRAALDGPRRAIKTGVAERDGWICTICLAPVDRALRFPDLMSASVDHIVLVANGGSNDAENLRLTHLGCNMRRGGWTIKLKAGSP